MLVTAPRNANRDIVDRIAELSPQLVTFNGSSFDLVHGVGAPGLAIAEYPDDV
jgi:hypothetical protein